jgi:vacuolar-type H+-ATPase subunit H
MMRFDDVLVAVFKKFRKSEKEIQGCKQERRREKESGREDVKEIRRRCFLKATKIPS